MILLHGFTFDMRSWDAQAEALSGRFQVVRYDLRGFGQSSLPTGPYSHVEDLLALLEALSLKTPVLVGLSLGANVALNFALDYPRAVHALILASPGLPGFAWTDERPPDAAAAFAKCHGIDATRQFWLDHQLFASLRRSPAAYARVRKMVQDYSGWHWHNVNPTSQASLSNRLSGCAPPTLILSGELDVHGYRQIAGTLCRELPQAKLLTFPNVGHVLNEEDPERFTSAVLAFVQSDSVRQSA